MPFFYEWYFGTGVLFYELGSANWNWMRHYPISSWNSINGLMRSFILANWEVTDVILMIVELDKMMWVRSLSKPCNPLPIWSLSFNTVRVYCKEWEVLQLHVDKNKQQQNTTILCISNFYVFLCAFFILDSRICHHRLKTSTERREITNDESGRGRWWILFYLFMCHFCWIYSLLTTS